VEALADVEGLEDLDEAGALDVQDVHGGLVCFHLLT